MKLHRSFVLALALAIPLAGCGDDDDEDLVLASAITVPVGAASIEAVVGETFSFGNADFLGAGFAASTTFSFPTASTYTATTGGTTQSGSVTFGSCTFNPPGVTVSECDIVVSNGAVRLRIGGRTSAPNEVSVQVNNNGNGQCTVRVGGVIVSGNASCTPATGTGGTSGIIMGPSGD